MLFMGGSVLDPESVHCGIGSIESRLEERLTETAADNRSKLMKVMDQFPSSDKESEQVNTKVHLWGSLFNDCEREM